MIQKQMKRLQEQENYINNLSMPEVQNNLLREDFYLYDCMHKNQKLIFETAKIPQERLFSLIEDCEVGSYDELQQLQIRLTEVLNVEWDHDKIAKLRSKYLEERHEIVGSGLTLKEMSHLLDPFTQKSVRDPLSSAFSVLLTPMPDKPYLYQFLDSAFATLEYNRYKESQKQQIAFNGEIQIKLAQNRQQNKRRNNDKIGQVIGLFTKMVELLQRNESGSLKHVKKGRKQKKI